MKRWISLLMLAVMLCGILAGCKPGGGGGAGLTDNADDAVVLTIALPRAEQRDTAEVVAQINKELETLLPNTKIELMLESGMADKWVLWMSTKKAIDIAHSGFVTNIEDEVRKDTYLELNELVEQYAPNIQKLRKDYWYSYDNSSINGKLYAIPNIQTHLKETLMLRVWKEGAKYFDLAAMNAEAYSSDKTTKKFWDLFTAGIENAAANGVNCSEIVNLTIYEVAKRGYNFIGGADTNFCYDNSDSGKIIDFYTTKEFKDFCDVMKLWASKGWVSKDILTGQWTDKLYAGTDTRYNMDPETKIKRNVTADTNVIFDLNDPAKDVVTTNIGQNMTYYSIPFSAKNPARAIKFLDLLNSEEGKVINNMLAYGIEGKHYAFVDKEKGDIKAFEYEGQGGADVSYGIANWMAGNMMLQYSISPYTHEELEYAENYYLHQLNQQKKHVLYGFSFDLEGVLNEFNKVMKNNMEYAESIYCGIIENTDKLMKELEEKNKAAGQEKVMAELQKQADDYIASKK